jgi:hypothetical protein
MDSSVFYRLESLQCTREIAPFAAPIERIYMTDTAFPLQRGNYPPFLPMNFYEAPQYASFRPISIPSHPPLTPPQRPSSTVLTASNKGIGERKTLRTVSVLFNPDGRMTGAKIDLATGEVQQHDYKDYYNKSPKATANLNAPDVEPFWMSMPAATRSTGIAPLQDKSRVKLINGCKMYIRELQRLDDLEGDLLLAAPLASTVAKELPMLMEIIESVNLLDMGGNTRGLSTAALLGMLATLDVITPATVRNFMDCSERHSRRVASCLRVIVNAFMMRAEGKLSTATRLTPPKKRAVRKRGQRMHENGHQVVD